MRTGQKAAPGSPPGNPELSRAGAPPACGSFYWERILRPRHTLPPRAAPPKRPASSPKPSAFPAKLPPKIFARQIAEANRDERVDAILVQLPLPTRELARNVFDALDPAKDVDGFHPENAGLLHQGRPRFVPCTPAGILALLDAHEVRLAGRRAVVVGRSDIVGKPTACLLTSRDATVALCHSKTPNLPALCREAELLVVAMGQPGKVTGDWIREGAVVVDVGIHRFENLAELPDNLQASPRLQSALAEKGYVFVGDVDHEAAGKVASGITPVPGGVGPLTVAMLLKNTVEAARMRRTR